MNQKQQLGRQSLRQTDLRRLLVVVMDGVGARPETFGNAVSLARTPYMRWLHQNGVYGELCAHGTAVGLPSDQDIGNSEVGHNAMGAGRIFDQGAKLVQTAISSGRMFAGKTWQRCVQQVKDQNSTLHFLGLLSDGNVHSHIDHLFSMLREAKAAGVGRCRVHVLFDGRDVKEPSAELYAAQLESVIAELKSSAFDVQIASGGGRMQITMDRYEADWSMVESGWHTHVLGLAPSYPSVEAALKAARNAGEKSDQFLPPFVIDTGHGPVGKIVDGDAVVFFNFRGDRAIEISRAFTEKDFDKFDRQRFPDVFYAGMMCYDGDIEIPEHFLVEPPEITDTLTEYLLSFGVRQFACSETQKFGHVTYFWNGNRSGKLDPRLETYVEIPSESPAVFSKRPWMKADEITAETCRQMRSGSFDFGRINYANGDMVGHTGDLEAAVIAVAVVDAMLGRLIQAAQDTGTLLLVTADHGNCDEMFDAKAKDFPEWEDLPLDKRPPAKTSHTLSPVPFYLYDPLAGGFRWRGVASGRPTLGHIASTCIELLGLPAKKEYLPSLVTR